MDHSFWNSAFTSTLKLLHLALFGKTYYDILKRTFQSVVSRCFPVILWLIVVYNTNINVAQYPPTFASFNQNSIPFISDQAYTIKTDYFEVHIMFLASRICSLIKDCALLAFSWGMSVSGYTSIWISAWSYDISCTSPVIQFTTETYAKKQSLARMSLLLGKRKRIHCDFKLLHLVFFLLLIPPNSGI